MEKKQAWVHETAAPQDAGLSGGGLSTKNEELLPKNSRKRSILVIPKRVVRCLNSRLEIVKKRNEYKSSIRVQMTPFHEDYISVKAVKKVELKLRPDQQNIWLTAVAVRYDESEFPYTLGNITCFISSNMGAHKARPVCTVQLSQGCFFKFASAVVRKNSKVIIQFANEVDEHSSPKVRFSVLGTNDEPEAVELKKHGPKEYSEREALTYITTAHSGNVRPWTESTYPKKNCVVLITQTPTSPSVTNFKKVARSRTHDCIFYHCFTPGGVATLLNTAEIDKKQKWYLLFIEVMDFKATYLGDIAKGTTNMTFLYKRSATAENRPTLSKTETHNFIEEASDRKKWKTIKPYWHRSMESYDGDTSKTLTSISHADLHALMNRKASDGLGVSLSNNEAQKGTNEALHVPGAQEGLYVQDVKVPTLFADRKDVENIEPVVLTPSEALEGPNSLLVVESRDRMAETVSEIMHWALKGSEKKLNVAFMDLNTNDPCLLPSSPSTNELADGPDEKATEREEWFDVRTAPPYIIWLVEGKLKKKITMAMLMKAKGIGTIETVAAKLAKFLIQRLCPRRLVGVTPISLRGAYDASMLIYSPSGGSIISDFIAFAKMQHALLKKKNKQLGFHECDEQLGRELGMGNLIQRGRYFILLISGRKRSVFSWKGEEEKWISKATDRIEMYDQNLWSTTYKSGKVAELDAMVLDENHCDSTGVYYVVNRTLEKRIASLHAAKYDVVLLGYQKSHEDQAVARAQAMSLAIQQGYFSWKENEEVEPGKRHLPRLVMMVINLTDNDPMEKYFPFALEDVANQKQHVTTRAQFLPWTPSKKYDFDVLKEHSILHNLNVPVPQFPPGTLLPFCSPQDALFECIARVYINVLSDRWDQQDTDSNAEFDIKACGLDMHESYRSAIRRNTVNYQDAESLPYCSAKRHKQNTYCYHHTLEFAESYRSDFLLTHVAVTVSGGVNVKAKKIIVKVRSEGTSMSKYKLNVKNQRKKFYRYGPEITLVALNGPVKVFPPNQKTALPLLVVTDKWMVDVKSIFREEDCCEYDELEIEYTQSTGFSTTQLAVRPRPNVQKITFEIHAQPESFAVSRDFKCRAIGINLKNKHNKKALAQLSHVAKKGGRIKKYPLLDPLRVESSLKGDHSFVANLRGMNLYSPSMLRMAQRISQKTIVLNISAAYARTPKGIRVIASYYTLARQLLIKACKEGAFHIGAQGMPPDPFSNKGGGVSGLLGGLAKIVKRAKTGFDDIEEDAKRRVNAIKNEADEAIHKASNAALEEVEKMKSLKLLDELDRHVDVLLDASLEGLTKIEGIATEALSSCMTTYHAKKKAVFEEIKLLAGLIENAKDDGLDAAIDQVNEKEDMLKQKLQETKATMERTLTDAMESVEAKAAALTAERQERINATSKRIRIAGAETKKKSIAMFDAMLESFHKKNAQLTAARTQIQSAMEGALDNTSRVCDDLRSRGHTMVIGAVDRVGDLKTMALDEATMQFEVFVAKGKALKAKSEEKLWNVKRDLYRSTKNQLEELKASQGALVAGLQRKIANATAESKAHVEESFERVKKKQEQARMLLETKLTKLTEFTAAGFEVATNKMHSLSSDARTRLDSFIKECINGAKTTLNNAEDKFAELEAEWLDKIASAERKYERIQRERLLHAKREIKAARAEVARATEASAVGAQEATSDADEKINDHLEELSENEEKAIENLKACEAYVEKLETKCDQKKGMYTRTFVAASLDAIQVVRSKLMIAKSKRKAEGKNITQKKKILNKLAAKGVACTKTSLLKLEEKTLRMINVTAERVEAKRREFKAGLDSKVQQLGVIRREKVAQVEKEIDQLKSRYEKEMRKADEDLRIAKQKAIRQLKKNRTALETRQKLVIQNAYKEIKNATGKAQEEAIAKFDVLTRAQRRLRRRLDSDIESMNDSIGNSVDNISKRLDEIKEQQNKAIEQHIKIIQETKDATIEEALEAYDDLKRRQLERIQEVEIRLLKVQKAAHKRAEATVEHLRSIQERSLLMAETRLMQMNERSRKAAIQTTEVVQEQIIKVLKDREEQAEKIQEGLMTGITEVYERIQTRQKVAMKWAGDTVSRIAKRASGMLQSIKDFDVDDLVEQHKRRLETKLKEEFEDRMLDINQKVRGSLSDVKHQVLDIKQSKEDLKHRVDKKIDEASNKARDGIESIRERVEEKTEEAVNCFWRMTKRLKNTLLRSATKVAPIELTSTVSRMDSILSGLSDDDDDVCNLKGTEMIFFINFDDQYTGELCHFSISEGDSSFELYTSRVLASVARMKFSFENHAFTDAIRNFFVNPHSNSSGWQVKIIGVKGEKSRILDSTNMRRLILGKSEDVMFFVHHSRCKFSNEVYYELRQQRAFLDDMCITLMCMDLQYNTLPRFLERYLNRELRLRISRWSDSDGFNAGIPPYIFMSPRQKGLHLQMFKFPVALNGQETKDRSTRALITQFIERTTGGRLKKADSKDKKRWMGMGTYEMEAKEAHECSMVKSFDRKRMRMSYSYSDFLSGRGDTFEVDMRSSIMGLLTSDLTNRVLYTLTKKVDVTKNNIFLQKELSGALMLLLQKPYVEATEDPSIYILNSLRNNEVIIEPPPDVKLVNIIGEVCSWYYRDPDVKSRSLTPMHRELATIIFVVVGQLMLDSDFAKKSDLFLTTLQARLIEMSDSNSAVFNDLDVGLWSRICQAILLFFTPFYMPILFANSIWNAKAFEGKTLYRVMLMAVNTLYGIGAIFPLCVFLAQREGYLADKIYVSLMDAVTPFGIVLVTYLQLAPAVMRSYERDAIANEQQLFCFLAWIVSIFEDDSMGVINEERVHLYIGLFRSDFLIKHIDPKHTGEQQQISLPEGAITQMCQGISECLWGMTTVCSPCISCLRKYWAKVQYLELSDGEDEESSDYDDDEEDDVENRTVEEKGKNSVGLKKVKLKAERAAHWDERICVLTLMAMFEEQMEKQYQKVKNLASISWLNVSGWLIWLSQPKILYVFAWLASAVNFTGLIVVNRGAILKDDSVKVDWYYQTAYYIIVAVPNLVGLSFMLFALNLWISLSIRVLPQMRAIVAIPNVYRCVKQGLCFSLSLTTGTNLSAWLLIRKELFARHRKRLERIFPMERMFKFLASLGLVLAGFNIYIQIGSDAGLAQGMLYLYNMAIVVVYVIVILWCFCETNEILNDDVLEFLSAEQLNIGQQLGKTNSDILGSMALSPDDVSKPLLHNSENKSNKTTNNTDLKTTPSVSTTYPNAANEQKETKSANEETTNNETSVALQLINAAIARVSNPEYDDGLYQTLFGIRITKAYLTGLVYTYGASLVTGVVAYLTSNNK